jgi:hypothetical protein
MRIYYELANFLVSSWKLAHKDARMPVGLGVFDRALELVVGDLPTRFLDTLRFVETPVGRLCVEIPDIIGSAQASFLITEPSFVHQTVGIKIGAAGAMDLLDELEIDIVSARDFGRKLGAAINDNARKVREAACPMPALVR